MCSLQLHHAVHNASANKVHSQSQGLSQRHGIRVVASYSLRRHSVGIKRVGWCLPAFKSKRKSLSRGGFCYARALAIPVPSNEIANAVKLFAKSTIARVLQIIHGSPLLQQCAPAAGLMAFAMWGLGPLLRFIHRTVLHKEDRSWKESQLNYIMRMYVRPVMLWIGVILICRAFDPVVLSTESSQAIKQRFINFVRSLSTVLAFAYCTNSVIQQLHKVMLDRQDTPDSRSLGAQFVGNAVYTAVWIAAVCLFMELLGFSTQKMLTAGGLGTVLLTLAGREIFTNFLSSIMIHATRPFVLNEWIQTKIDGYEVSGTVEHVGWWSPTIVRGDDREAVHIPNHKFTVSIVRNLSQKSHWRIKTYFGISHLDVSKISSIVADMRKVLAKHPQVEQRRLHRRVFFESINPENQALMVLVSCFVKTPHFEEYLRVKEVILLDLMKVISHHHARLATPIRSVQRVLDDIEPRASPFRDVNRAAEAQGRPYLLIEASAYRDSEQSPSSKNGASQARDDASSDVDDNTSGSTVSPKKEGLQEKDDTLVGAGKIKVAHSSDGASGLITNSKKESLQAGDDTLNDDGIAKTALSSSGLTINPKKEGIQAKDDDSNKDGAIRSANPLDNTPESIINPKKALHAKDHTLDNDRTAKSAHPSDVGESKVTSKHKPQLEGLDSMGLNSKDITLLGAAFEKPPVKIPEDPIESQLHGEKTFMNPASDIGSTRTERNSGQTSEHALQPLGNKVQKSHVRIGEPLGVSAEKNSEKIGKTMKDVDSGPLRDDKSTTEELAGTDLLHATQKNDTRRPQVHNASPSKGEIGGHTLASKTQLGENLVLGVALNGPKQTLPLDDEISPAVEQKELVASSNGNVNNTGKDGRPVVQPPNVNSEST